MPISNPSATAVIELSRAEQWVLHHVLLDAIGLADGRSGHVGKADAAAAPYLAVIEKLEAGTFEFTVEELELIRRAIGAHARTTDLAADRNLASAVADRISATLADRPRRH